MATIVGCAGFGAICGSSIATAATFAKVAYPSMKKFGYSDALATGSIAAGGTLGILIPPSTIMVIYGIMTGTSIGKLFAAGILPGILATALLCLAVQYVTWRDRAAGPRGERLSWKERFDTLHGVGWFAAVGVAVVASASFGWLESDDAAVLGALAVFGLSLVYKGVTSVIALFALVMGGIYGGVFTAGRGRRRRRVRRHGVRARAPSLTWRALYAALVESARTTAMLFMILIGALMFAEFVNITTMPDDLKNFVNRLQLSPIMVVAVIMAIYVILGTAMEELLDDPADRAGVLPADRAPRHRPDLLRRPDRGGGRDRPDQPAGGHEPVRAQHAAAAGADARHLPRRAAVHDDRLRAPRHPDRLPDPVAMAAQAIRSEVNSGLADECCATSYFNVRSSAATFAYWARRL
jgi:TRAP-type C4-dicarboxylate transport system permease large subunit